MEEMTKRTELRDTNQTSSIVQRIVGIGFGIVQISLLFRLVFKWLGANPQNGFVQSLYAVTQLFVGFFEGIFSRVVTNGEQTSGYFEPATYLIYAIGAVVGLIGGVKVYSKFSAGDPDTSKTAASWFGACIFLIVAATILRSFFL